MNVTAKANFIRMSPRKVRLLADLVRGLGVDAAQNQLSAARKHAAGPVLKLLRSALANATHNFDLKADNLFVKAISVDEGPMLKRWMPRARGRATPIHKKSSHVAITLGELVESGTHEGKKPAVAAPVKITQQPKHDEGVKVPVEGKAATPETAEAGHEIVDPRSLGKGKHVRKEGGGKQGFAKRFFQRKSG